MADIKTRDAVKGTIKTIDKAAVASERMKSAYSKIKDKAEQGCYADENSATEYAADKVSAASERITDEGVHQFNKQGQKAVKTTKDNIVKAKDKLSEFIFPLKAKMLWLSVVVIQVTTVSEQVFVTALNQFSSLR